MPSQPSFTEPEVEAILARAIEHAESGKAKLSLEDLVAVGAELGVSRAAIESAAAEVVERPEAPSQLDGDALDEDSSRKMTLEVMKSRKQARWYRNLYVYLAVNAFLLFVNLMTSPEHLWVLWPVGGWGLAMVLMARRAFFMSEEEAEEALAHAEHHWRRAENRRARKEARRERKEARRTRRRGPIPPIDDAGLRARIDARVDSVLAERGVRVAAPEPEGRRVHDERVQEEEDEEAPQAQRQRSQAR